MLRRISPRPLLALSASILLLCSAGAGVVISASRPSDASNLGALGATVQRTVVWGPFPPPSAAPRAFWVSSTSVDTPTPDAFQISYNQGTFSLDYQRENASYTAAHVAVTVDALVEWNDTAGTGTIENDSILTTVPLGSAGFGQVPIQHAVSFTQDGGEIHSFRISSNNGEVVLNLTIAERFIPLSQTKILTPMEAELGVEIAHTIVTPSARIGLLLTVQTQGSLSVEPTSWDDVHEFSRGDHSLNVTDTSHGMASSVFFSWQTQAQVNGAFENVTATEHEVNETAPGTWDLYLAYGGDGMASGTAARVVHDPNLGVVSVAYDSIVPVAPPLQGDYVVYAVTAGAVGALVVGTVVLAARGRRRP